MDTHYDLNGERLQKQFLACGTHRVPKIPTVGTRLKQVLGGEIASVNAHPRGLPAQAGFTLIEMMVTIVVYGLMMVATATLLRMIYMNGASAPLALNAIDQSRAVGTLFANEIRDASIGADGSFALAEASSTEIIFFSPFDSGSSTTVERIRYYLSGTKLYKGVIVPSGSPAGYGGTEAIMPVLSGLTVGTTSIFSYFNGSYSGTSSALTQPVNVNQVTYVSISVTMPTQDVRNGTTTFRYTTGATIRSLKTNLGN